MENKVYIFASGEYSLETQDEVNKITLDTDDKIVLCNKPTDESLKYLLNIKYDREVDFRFFRGHHPHISKDYEIFSMSEFNHDKCLYYISETAPKYLEKIKENNKLKDQSIVLLDNKSTHLLFDEKYPPTHTPSIGFIAAHEMMGKYPNRTISLVGFTFEGWHGHAMSFEKEYFQNYSENVVVL